MVVVWILKMLVSNPVAQVLVNPRPFPCEIGIAVAADLLELITDSRLRVTANHQHMISRAT